jgi:hypothetical protein
MEALRKISSIYMSVGIFVNLSCCRVFAR